VPTAGPFLLWTIVPSSGPAMLRAAVAIVNTATRVKIPFFAFMFALATPNIWDSIREYQNSQKFSIERVS
jgi:hypothetical protein